MDRSVENYIGAKEISAPDRGSSESHPSAQIDVKQALSICAKQNDPAGTSRRFLNVPLLGRKQGITDMTRQHFTA
jgi:hypothetical protein